MTEYTNDEKRKAVLRELGQRLRVYPRLVAAGKMTQKESDYQISVMRSIVDDYETLAHKERLL